MASDARRIVQSVLSDHMTAQVWTSTYPPVLPFTPQGFSVGALLPTILYLFRWGHRRGKGRFAVAFAPAEGGAPTIASVAGRLAREPNFDGFEPGVREAILCDVLLTSSLENKRHAEGHHEQVQRNFASHYMASWIDLPVSSSHLRGVPEVITALLNEQTSGSEIDPFKDRGRYSVGSRVQDHELLSVFAKGISTEGEHKSNTKSDKFNERSELGLDEFVMVRLAQACGEAPEKAKGKGEPGPIPNQRPIARRAAKIFREDFSVFFDCYGRGGAVPRMALLAMLEAAFAVGLSTILLETVDLMLRWSQTGEVESDKARPMPIFIDCSNNAEESLRDVSEHSNQLLRQALSRVPAVLMYIRLLDQYVSKESDVKVNDPAFARSPDGTAWLNLLGSFANGGHEEARDAEKYFRSKTRSLAEAVETETDSGFDVQQLKDESAGHHGRRLADALQAAFDRTNKDKLDQFLSSALMVDEPNGLAKRRKIALNRIRGVGQKRTGDADSFILSNIVLEYLVHRHVHKPGKGRKPKTLSYPDFLRILRERYGFHVDQAPPNLAVSAELLQRNRRALERRLRDLGLLSGVNDAERMKKLKPRYAAYYAPAPCGEKQAT